VLKLLAIVVLTSAILGLAILAFSRIYDSPVVHDGPVYPSIASSQTLLPIDSNPFPSENCSDIASRALLTAESLGACTEESQCQLVWNANLGFGPGTINRANIVAFEKLANEVASYCGERLYAWLPGQGYKVYCKNLKCGSEFIAVETKQGRLRRESLSIQRTNSIEAQ
jgi:hypothetical protein